MDRFKRSIRRGLLVALSVMLVTSLLNMQALFADEAPVEGQATIQPDTDSMDSENATADTQENDSSDESLEGDTQSTQQDDESSNDSEGLALAPSSTQELMSSGGLLISKDIAYVNGDIYNGEPVCAGDEVTYEIAFTNPTWQAVTMTDALPAGVEYVGASDVEYYGRSDGDVCEYDEPSSTVKCGIKYRSSGKVRVTVSVVDDSQESITNEATIWGYDPYKQYFAASDSATIKVIEQQPPTITKTVVGDAEVSVGDKVTYEIAINNLNCSSVTMRDALPPGVEHVSNSDNCRYDEDSNSVECEVAGNSSDTVRVTVKVVDDSQESITNEATIRWGSDLTVSDSATVRVIEKQTTTVTKTVISEAGYDGAPVSVGDTVTYAITYNNPTCQYLILTDTLPKGTQFEGATGLYKLRWNTITWSIAPGTSGTVTVTVTIKDSAVDSIVNEATIGTCCAPIDTSTVINPVAEEDPTITKTVVSAAGYNGSPVSVGDEITYKITITNPTHDDFTMSDKLPAGVEYVSSSQNSRYYKYTNTIIYQVKPYSTADVYVTVKVTDNTIDYIDNTAYLWNRGSIECFAEVINPVTHEIITKTVVSEAGYDGAAVVAGDEVTYLITYQNPNNYQVALVDVLPAGVDFVRAMPRASISIDKQTLSWIIDPHESGMIRVTVKVNDEAVESITNYAKLCTCCVGTIAEATVTNPVASLAPTKEVISETGYDGAPVSVGDEITYKITYNDATADQAVLIDYLPEGVDFVSATNNGEENVELHAVEWLIPPGWSDYVEVTVRVNEKAVESIDNYAALQIGENEYESNIVINPLAEDPGPAPDPEPLKVVYNEDGDECDGVSVSIGDHLTYEISCVNNSGETADMYISDRIPDGETIIESSADYTIGDDGTVVWEIPDVAPGDAALVTITVTVNGYEGVSELVNTAYVQLGEGATPYATNTVTNPRAEEPTPITMPAKSVYDSNYKECNGKTVAINDVLIYKISWTNNTGETTDLRIIDKLPAGENLMYSDTLFYFLADGSVEWDLTGILPGDEVAVIAAVKCTGGEGISALANTAYVVVGEDTTPYYTNTVINPISNPAPTPVNPDTTKPVSTTSGKITSSSTPKTGDTQIFWIYGATIALLAASSILSITMYRNRRNRREGFDTDTE